MGGLASGSSRENGVNPLTRLPKRLLAVARYVAPETTVADIGCGDGSLSVYLAQARRCRVIATEASAAGLSLAARRVAAAGAGVELRRGRGLEPLRPGEAEVIIVAGMGGITISQILQRRPPGVVPRYFVLQPMERAAHLRTWLHGQRWVFLDEDLVREGKRIYEIIVARPPGEAAGAAQEATRPPLAGGEVGTVLVAKKHPLLDQFLAAKISKYRRLLAAIDRSRRPGAEEARAKAAAVLADLEALAAQLRTSTER